jgi:tRNA (guanine-N7-)-methyltransferase
VRTKHLAEGKNLAHPWVAIVDEDWRRPDWREVFGAPGPLHLELGMGNGRHLVDTALREPGWCHVGLDAKHYRVEQAVRRAERYGVEGVRFLVGDLFEMPDPVEDGTLSRLTILFPDPWPRARGDRFRLTNPTLVERYRRWLAPGGSVHFRTDHEALFIYSVRRFEEAGFRVDQTVPLDRVVSEFESKFLARGQEIYGLVASLT